MPFLKICFADGQLVAQTHHLGNTPQKPRTRVAVLLCFPNVLHFHLHIQDLPKVRVDMFIGDKVLVGAGKRLKR